MASECEYPKLSLSNKDKIMTVSTDCLRMIGKLDKSSEQLSHMLDRKTRDLVDKGDAANDADRAEIESILRVLEIIANHKISLAIRSYDYLDNNIKAVDLEMTLIERALRDNGAEIPILDISNRELVTADGKKKRKRSDEEEEVEEVVCAALSAEPVYCTCKRVAFGEMIACDNEDCPIEWFHYPCVNLTRKPRNSWICPLCSNKKRK